MYEYIFFCIVAIDKTVATFNIEPFYCSSYFFGCNENGKKNNKKYEEIKNSFDTFCDLYLDIFVNKQNDERDEGGKMPAIKILQLLRSHCSRLSLIL